jgi:transposase
MIPIKLRKRIVDAYTSGLSGSYDATAELFGVGRATVNRLLQRYRATGDVKALPVGGNNPRRVDLDWLRTNAEEHPDARLVDRIEAWEKVCGRQVASSTMSVAMRTIGWTHKKKRRLPTSGNETT